MDTWITDTWAEIEAEDVGFEIVNLIPQVAEAKG